MQFIFGLVLMITGILNIAFPEAMWSLSNGWQFKNAEPSDAALALRRLGGIVGIIASFVVMISF